MKDDAELGRKIGFIGAGQMADTIIRGLLKLAWPTAKIFLLPHIENRVKYFDEQLNIKNAISDMSVIGDLLVDNCDIILLAVKPQVLKEVMERLQGLLAGEKAR